MNTFFHAFCQYDLIKGARGAPLTYGQIGFVGVVVVVVVVVVTTRNFSAATEPISDILADI